MASSDRPPLADRMRRQMRLLGLSQKAVAERVQVSQQTVSKWLTGETQPRVKLLPVLAEVLSLDPAELSAAMIAAEEPARGDAASDLRLAALDRQIRELTPAQMDQLEAYLRGLRDGARTQ